MTLDSGDDDFGDSEDELMEALDRQALNRNVEVIRSSRPVSRQYDLTGKLVEQSPQYEEVQQVVTFGPTHHQLNYENLQSYIYPTNFEVRDYQFNITKRAFYDNLLCALPTGLGKTFIASTVMLNFYRWTNTSKIIFMAPTRPLVAQQIKACCSITGIPAHDVAILLDKTRRNRAEIWEEKRVFFTTPQVVENDLSGGLVDPKDIVLLVVDEAHRAKGNYAYNNVVKFIQRFNNSFRILALTATPASDVEGVQEIIDNLDISKVEVRTEESIDTRKYMKRRIIDKITVNPNDDILDIVDSLSVAIAPTLEQANKAKIYDVTDPSKINAFTAMDAGQRVSRNPSLPNGLKWHYYFLLQLLGVVGQAYKKLNIYGVRSFYSYFKDKYTEFTTKYDNKKSTNKIAAGFYYNPKVKQVLEKCEELLVNDNYLGHPKLEYLLDELLKFFKDKSAEDSRVIIFTEFRDSALDIVRGIECIPGTNLRAHIFIGQSKEKDKFSEDNYLKKGGGSKKGKKTKKATAEEDEDEDDLSEKGETWRPNSKTKIGGKTASSRVTSSEDAQSKGMNQKMQKELIRKFKKGEYNILVATSIGEEGLDIGEVDLIVCFDSTSSPIKNVQRMGRTGRKRDGKIILLFSSNEESKFDKAMGGYEYIQKHMMDGDIITLQKSDRIIPKKYDPVCEKKKIDIPEENTEMLKAEDDEDEIIRIATSYMTGRGKGKKKSKKGKQPAKIQKRFFMPDNVETGFQDASKLVRKINHTEESSSQKYDRLQKERRTELKESAEKNRSDILDLFNSDSEIEQDSFLHLDKKRKLDSKTNESQGFSIQRNTVLCELEDFSDIEKADGELKVSEEKKQSISIILDDSDDDINGIISTFKSRPSPSSFDELNLLSGTKVPRLVKPVTTEKKRLGATRRPYNLNPSSGGIIDQIKSQQSKVIKPILSNETIVVPDSPEKEDFFSTPVQQTGSLISQERNTEVSKDNLSYFDEDVDFSDDFNDGLDDLLEDKLSSDPPKKIPNSSSSQAVPPILEETKLSARDYNVIPTDEPVRSSKKPATEDELFKNVFEPHEGVLTEQQQEILYTNYFTTLDSSDLCYFFDPSIAAKRAVGSFRAGHSSKSLRFMESISMMQKEGEGRLISLMNEILDNLEDSESSKLESDMAKGDVGTSNRDNKTQGDAANNAVKQEFDEDDFDFSVDEFDEI